MTSNHDDSIDISDGAPAAPVLVNGLDPHERLRELADRLTSMPLDDDEQRAVSELLTLAENLAAVVDAVVEQRNREVQNRPRRTWRIVRDAAGRIDSLREE